MPKVLDSTALTSSYVRTNLLHVFGRIEFMKVLFAGVFGLLMALSASARQITFDDPYGIPSPGSAHNSPDGHQIVYVLSTNNLSTISSENRKLPQSVDCSKVGLFGILEPGGSRLDLSEGLQMFTTLQRLGVPSELVYFSDEGDGIGKLENLRFVYQKQFEWLDRWLKR
jgi:hypothetical protein